MPATQGGQQAQGGHGTLGQLKRFLAPRPPRPRSAPSLPPVAGPGPHDTLATARMRTPVSLRGTISMVTINPRGVNRWLEAVLDDGTGEVLLLWMGRRMVRGIEAGRTVEVTGTLTLFEGRKAIYNPNYTLRP